MENHWIISVIVYALMACILISLGSGLYFILFRKGKPEQAVKALTMRVGLSLFLFVLLMGMFAMGWITPHAIIPTSKQTQTEKAIPHPQNANTMPLPQTQSGGLA